MNRVSLSLVGSESEGGNVIQRVVTLLNLQPLTVSQVKLWLFLQTSRAHDVRSQINLFGKVTRFLRESQEMIAFDVNT